MRISAAPSGTWPSDSRRNRKFVGYAMTNEATMITAISETGMHQSCRHSPRERMLQLQRLS